MIGRIGRNLGIIGSHINNIGLLGIEMAARGNLMTGGKTTSDGIDLRSPTWTFQNLIAENTNMQITSIRS